MSQSRPCLYSSVHSRDKQRNDMSISNLFHKPLTILSQSPKSSTSIYPIFQTLSHIFQSQPHPSNTDCILRLLSVALGESGGGGGVGKMASSSKTKDTQCWFILFCHKFHPALTVNLIFCPPPPGSNPCCPKSDSTKSRSLCLSLAY